MRASIVHSEQSGDLLSMIDIYKLLQIKENELARVRKEIESLQVVAGLLSEPEDAHVSQNDASEPAVVQIFVAPKQNVAQYESRPEPAEILFRSMAPKGRRLKSWFRRAVGE
jgi:hypothetical protein